MGWLEDLFALGGAGLGPILERDRNYAQHILGGSRLAGPNLELPGRLMNKHLDTWNHRDSLRARDL